MKQLALDFAIAPPPTLENFAAGRNAELLQHLRWLTAGDLRERSFYIWGGPGCGRSHLLRGMVAALRGAGSSAAYVACAPGAALPEGLDRLDGVALDDVDQLDPDAQIAAFHLCNILREHQGALVASGAAPPAQLRLREDLVTRLGWGLVFQVHALTDEEKARALADRAAARGFRLPPEVCEFLLARVRRDMPSLLEILDALDRYSLQAKRPITVPLAREWLADRREAGIEDPGPRSRSRC
ncbi:MAG TPA: DnaA regulatory inactivator Hda [Burkholderiales bacterium]|nr:DnaA regulatory inactivator Hda [Burkholderiales bacterium]